MTKVVKLAQPGYDVKTAGDQNLIYNSNWPLLKIYKSGKFTTTNLGVSNQTIITHDLNYIPFFIYFSNYDIRAWNGTFGTPLFSSARSEFMGPIAGGVIGTDANEMFLNINSANFTGQLEIEYYLFALDLDKVYNAPKINIGSGVGATDNGPVFKIAKPGKNITSPNLKDYVVHSDARSPLIHQVSPGLNIPDGNVVTGFSHTVNHDLNYNPMFFAFNRQVLTGRTNPSYNNFYTGSLGTVRFNVNNTKIVFQGTSIQSISIVVLKDPFDADYSVSVNI